jgi:ComF family protein
MTTWAQDFMNLFYPQVCLGCATSLVDGENILCIACKSQLPVAYHDLEHSDKIQELFFARLPIHHATSLFYYEKIGAVQRLIHALKYQRQEQISAFMGLWLASYLQHNKQLDDVDAVIPVPVHKRRLQKRGYNQVTDFGRCIADGLGSRFRESVLTKTRNTIKQAQLDQRRRTDESNSPYKLQEEVAPGSHVLLVDDVITTGTTLTMCARELMQVADIRISVATMAISV